MEVTAVGFEPTQLALVELESTPLDHSGKLSLTASVTYVLPRECVATALPLPLLRPCLSPQDVFVIRFRIGDEVFVTWRRAKALQGIAAFVRLPSRLQEAPYGDRTRDHTLTKRMLYQLS